MELGQALRIDEGSLRARFEAAEAGGLRTPETLAILGAVTAGLQEGRLRVVEWRDGGWEVNSWLKRALLLQSRLGEARLQDGGMGVELDTAPWRTDLPAGVLMAGGSYLRAAAYVGAGCVLTPPSVVQAGAFVGSGSVVDAHVIVGICARVGERVVIQSGATVGGVMLPLEGMPNVVEDDCFLQAGSGLFDGVVLGAGSVLLPGALVRRAAGVFDLRSDEWIRADGDGALVIPPLSVVGMGTMPIGAAERGLQVAIAMIVGTRRSVDETAIDYVQDLPCI